VNYKTYDPDQLFLLPPSLKEWLPENHLAYFVSDVVDELDLGEIEQTYSTRLQGQPPYHPAMMVKLLFYAYCTGIPSSRKIEKKTYEDIAFRILAAGHHPDHDTVADFRKNHLSADAPPLQRSKTGQARPCVPRRDEDESKRLQAQGHELREDA
jgi:transposase